DDATTNMVNKRLLITQGFAENVSIAMSAEKALKYLHQLAEEETATGVDLIFLDLKMRSRDGYWFLEQYEKRKDIAKARMVIALTSSASFYDLEKLKQHPDVLMHIYKPLSGTHLNELEERILQPVLR
ncbi:MAG: response regulator, partial [Sphingobacteriales bacterium]